MESYLTIKGVAAASLIEKKSEFIANVSFADTEEKALAFLESIRAQHRTARHNVYAYLLRADGRCRYSDDGEPAKTAGTPVLEVIQHAGLTDVIVVVTRYFGGILLGTGGLVRAYTGAAQLGLAAAQQVVVCPVVDVTLAVGYPLYERLQHLLDTAQAVVKDTAFGVSVTVSATMQAGRETPLLAALRELCRGEPDAIVSDVYYAPF